MTQLKPLVRSIPGSTFGWTQMRRFARWIQVTNDFLNFRQLSKVHRPSLVPHWRERRLCLDDRTPVTAFDRHYVYHTAWAMRQILRINPSEHVDISSSLYFAAMGSAIVSMRHVDYRPPMLFLDNLKCEAGNLLALPFDDHSIESLSCMHVIEHVGLGRYGDDLDALGDVKAARELSRVLAYGGRLLVVVPIGKAGICFNAHRIYSYGSIRELFSSLTLEETALIPDDLHQGIVVNPAPELIDTQTYACGCFAFRKPH